jgi:hypothetical protein
MVGKPMKAVIIYSGCGHQETVYIPDDADPNDLHELAQQGLVFVELSVDKKPCHSDQYLPSN